MKEKKCKICTNKFTPTRAIQPVCDKYECKLEYALKVAKKAADNKIKREKQRRAKETKELREKVKNLSDYRKEAQEVFNRYIRERDKGQPCISCGAKEYTVSCGHYFPSGKYKSVTFDEDNNHAQCWYYCNSKMSGNLIEYRKGLLKKIGEQRLSELEQRAKTIKQWKKHELIEIINTYKEKLKNLRNN